MGTYYLAVCDEKHEYLDPGRIGGGGIKAGACIHGCLANLVMHMITFGNWPSASMVSDNSDKYEHIEHDPGWRDVTLAAVAEFNQGTREDLQIPVSSELVVTAQKTLRSEGLILDVDGQPMTSDRFPHDARRRQIDMLTHVYEEPRDYLEAHLSPEGVLTDDAHVHVRKDQVAAVVTGYAIGYADGIKRVDPARTHMSKEAIRTLRQHLSAMFHE